MIVSAAIKTCKPRQFLLEALLDGKYALVTSDEIIREIRKVLGRPKFRLDESEINGAVSTLESLSNVIKTKSKFKVVEMDQDDDMFSSRLRLTGAPTISFLVTATCST